MNNNVSNLLNESQESLEFALQSGRMGTWEFDIETNRITCSREMLELWNISEAQFNNDRKILQSKVHPDDLEKMRAAIEKAIVTDTIYELEYRIIPQPEVIKWVFSRGRCKYFEGTKPERFSGIVYDITEKAELARARDQFFMIASHELKTPLTLLQLQHQVLESELRDSFPVAFDSPKVKEILFKQQENIQRISRIVDNMLDESQINHGKLNLHFESINLSQTLSDVIDRFKVSPHSNGIELLSQIESNITGHWDKFRLEQVILNLLSNAVRYGKGSPISVKLERDQQIVTLIVSDKGPGIKPEDQSRIFERFERVNDDQSIRGIGLGLFICHEIIQAHKGKIQVQSKPEEGASFVITLPV